MVCIRTMGFEEFIENDMMRDIYPICGKMKTLITFMRWNVAKEHT